MLAQGRMVRVLAVLAITFFATGLAAQKGQNGTPDRGNSAQAHAKKSFTPEQMDNVKARIALATSLVNRLGPEAQQLGRAEGWGRATLESLLALPLSSLQELQSVQTVDELATTMATVATEPAVIGETTQDLTYKPISPCRFIDTRNVGGKINGTRGYDLVLTGASYGGSAACDPTTLFGVGENSFGAIAMNMTIVDPSSAPGFGAIKPSSAAPVTSLINWYEYGPTVQLANQGILTMDQTGAASEFVIQTSAPVHVIIDIFGAFITPEATALECLDPLTFSNSYTVGTGISVFLYSKACTTGYTLVSGACYSSTDPVYLLANGTSSNNTQWFCKVNNLTGANTTTNVWARCCRLPGR